jgi:acyl carrier protein
VEEKLAQIFIEALGVEQVGVYDNFFALGGHSLLATQVVYHINALFGINLPMKSFFEQPIIANLALLVEEALLDEIEKSENPG